MGTYKKSLGQKLNMAKTSIFFSQNTLAETKQASLKSRGYHCRKHMILIWNFHHLLESWEPKFSEASRIEYGRDFRIGSSNSSLRRERKFFWRWSSKQYQLIVWAYFFSQNFYVRKLITLCKSFGGDIRRITKKYIGFVRTGWVHYKKPFFW